MKEKFSCLLLDIKSSPQELSSKNIDTICNLELTNDVKGHTTFLTPERNKRNVERFSKKIAHGLISSFFQQETPDIANVFLDLNK
jgi:hypothetical protein